MVFSRLFRAVSLVSSVALVAPLLSSNVALAATATTTSVTATPSPVVAGQSVTLTATTSVPGTVNFTVDGQTVGTGISSPATSSLTHTQLWEWGPGNSIAWASDIDANGNVATGGWNPGDCSGDRCKSKWITPAGGVTAFAGSDLIAYGIAIASSGIIYESNGSVIYKRNAYNQSPSVFLSTGLNNPCGLETDSNNNLYVANKGAGTILKVTPGGTATTYATGLTSPCGLALNANTGVLYVVDGNGDIQSIASANSTPVLLVAAQCTSDSKIAIDSSGYLYGRACVGDEIVTQISPTGAMSVFLPAWYNLPAQSQGAGQNSARDIVVLNNSIYVTGAHMTASNLRKFNAATYRSTLIYPTTQPGVLSLGASFTPSDSTTYSASSGTGSLSVVPPAPQTPDLATPSDLGGSSTDNATSDNTPRIEVPGSYSSGNTITVTATKSGSTNVTCSYIIPATGCDLGTLADGTWSINATDSHPTSGASSASTALSITIDTSRPTAPTSVDLVTASDTGSSSTDNNTSDTTPTLGATGGVNGDTMTISATNGSTTVSCTYVIGTTTNCTLPTLTDGTWNISSTLTDAAGNVSTASSSLPITIDTAGPQSLTPDLVPASDTGTSSTDNNTNDTTPTMTLTGQANGDVITMNASNGSTTLSCTYTVGASTNCILPTLSDGTWTISASVTDSAGNTGTSQSLNVTVDTTPPSAPSGVDLVASSDTGSSSTDNNTNDTTPTISASGGTNGDTMTISATNGGTTLSCTYVIGSATSCTLPTLTPGNWNISSTLTDPSGNTSTSSSALPISIDTTPPSAPSGVDLLASSDSGSSNTDNNTNDTTPTLSATGGTNGDTMTISATNGSTTVSCSYVIGTSTNCTLPTLTDGTWNISATLTDPSGNTSTSSSALPITIDGTAPAAPSGLDLLASSDTGSSSTDNFTGDNTPTLSATGGANGDTMTISTTNGTTTVSCTYVVGTATNCTLPTLTDGAWNISATITDPLGNVSPVSSSLPITIATTPPSRPAPDLLPSSDTGRSNSDNITNDTTPEISIPGAVAGDVVTVSATNGTSTVTCTYTAGSATRCSLPALTDGTWTVSASVTDAADNTGPARASLTITIDTNAAAASIEGIGSGSLPTSTAAETTPTVTPGISSLTGRIRFSPNAGAKGATAVVFTVIDKSGKIVSVITRKVSPSDKSASVTVSNNGSLAMIRVHTINKVGVSESALRGANIRRGKTSSGRLTDGRPSLTGDLLAEVLYFKPNSSELTPRTISVLNGLARSLNAKGGNLMVSGFARKNGIDTPRYLRNLSEQRAVAVAMYLSSRGVRLWTNYQGFGAVTKEIGTPAERRVEVRWVSNA